MDASISFREAVLADAARVRDIYAPFILSTVVSFEEQVPEVEDFEKRISEILPNFPWIVAEKDGVVEGYAYASPHKNRASYRWSADLAVYLSPLVRRQGVGSALYDKMLAILRELGYCNVLAGITLPNPASVRLHESVGFSLVGIYDQVGFKFGSWHDVGWWQLRLQDPAQPQEPIPYAEWRQKNEFRF